MVCRYELFYAEYFYLFALFSLLYYHFTTFFKKPALAGPFSTDWHGLIFRPCFYLYLHKTMKISINFSANLHRVLLTFLRHKFNIKNDRKFSEAVKNNEKQKRTFKRKILDPRMGARNRRTNLLEHGKPVVQHLCLRKNRKRSDNNLLDGWRFRNGNDHIHLPLRLYLRQNRQAQNNGVCRLYPLGHIHHCFRADAVSCARQQRHTVRAHGSRRCGRRGGCDNELLRLDGKRYRLQRMGQRPHERQQQGADRRGSCHSAGHRHDSRNRSRRNVSRQQ